MNEREQLISVIDMAKGKTPVDLLITNCKVVDVYNQILINGPLAIGNGKIIGFGHNYEAKETLDARGGIVMPGLIDGHVHIESSSLTPAQFARTILPFGTTTIIADPHEIGNVCGVKGIQYMLDASRDLPLHVKIQLPSCVPATPFESAGAVLEASDLEPLLEDDGVLGLGEVMDYPSVINHSEGMIDKLMMAKNHNRVIDGHSPGVKGLDLTAYISAGIETDHECSDMGGMLARLSMGQYILLREGSTCKDLLNLLPAVTPQNSRRCVFCTDDREPSDILATGHINKSLRLAVEAGLDPFIAITMGTLNAAECFKLKGKGAIAPGYDADLLIVKDLKAFDPLHVLSMGQEVASDGKMIVTLKEHHAEDVLNTIHIAPMSEEDLTLKLTTDTVHAIGVIPKSVVTKNLQLDVNRDMNGIFHAKDNAGLNKLAVIERHHASGKVGVGILSGYGIKNGAIAVSVAHDSHNIVVVGDNDSDMIAAIKNIEAIGGGFSLVQNGEVIGNLPLPIGGLMTNQTAEEVAEALEILINKARSHFNLSDAFHPLMTLVFMTLPVIPELKLTSNGLFDVKQFSLIDVSVH